jgi:ABC-2 type transport system ATP-binding protein
MVISIYAPNRVYSYLLGDQHPNDMNTAIEIRALCKRYRNRLAIDCLDLSIGFGEIFGFVGPNGAGKTTTIRILAGLLQPTSGEVSVAGFSIQRDLDEVKRRIGYMPDFFGVYPGLTVLEYLEFFSACYKIPEQRQARLINELLELVDLNHRRDDMVDQLSRGMKQRLSLARTLINDPQLLLLDEPAAGLDPRARFEIRELLVELARMGKTVFFSTHILSDVAEICDRVGIIEAGKLVTAGTLDQLRLDILPQRSIQLTLLDKDKSDEVIRLLAGKERVSQVVSVPPNNADGRLIITFKFNGDDAYLSQLLTDLVHNQVPVLLFSEDASNLEDVFMHSTSGHVT